MTVDITLGPHPEIEGAPMVGVLFDTIALRLDLPIDVDVDSRNIGGPSAGMTYALTVNDLLTPDDLTKGHVIAGPHPTAGPSPFSAADRKNFSARFARMLDREMRRKTLETGARGGAR